MKYYYRTLAKRAKVHASKAHNPSGIVTAVTVRKISFEERAYRAARSHRYSRCRKIGRNKP